MGQIIGEAEINIASMALGRADYHGKAMMIIDIDETASEAALNKLLEIQGIKRVVAMEFANAIIHERNIL